MSAPADVIPDQPRAATVPRALSSVQERRLTDHLDQKFLEIQRQYKKRGHETSSLRTLSTYTKAVHPLLSLILLIPPIEASVHLRASLLLRLTGDILECITGYTLESGSGLLEVLDMLDELDRGWLAVLRSQNWNAESREGVDLILVPSDVVDNNVRSVPISQTDRARLRSLILLGTEGLERWLEGTGLPAVPSEENLAEGEQAFAVIQARQRIDNLFYQTLSEMGELQGIVPVF